MITRRTFLTSLIAAAATTSSLVASAKPYRGSQKKGAGGKWALGQVQQLNPAWYYDWGRSSTGSLPYIPMIWGAESVESIDEIDRTSGVLLGFNEPDHYQQSHMSVEDALEYWPELEATGLRLGSPAVATPESPWIVEFMERAEGMRVDFMTMHWYGMPDATAFIRDIENFYDKFQRPIWITEFACANWGAANRGKALGFNQIDVYSFMSEVIPVLESLPYVERYVWMDGDNDPALQPSALFNPNGTITPLGIKYSGI